MRDLSKSTVLVTGASGFLGQRLVRRLVPVAKHVIAFARGGATGVLHDLDGAEIVIGDVLSQTDVNDAVAGVDLVFHLAGRSGAQASQSDPRSDLDVNVGGLTNVLEALARNPGVRIVMPGSRLEYGAPEALPVREDAPLRPTSAYGLHKRFCQMQLDFYARLHGLSFAFARLTNPYGFWRGRGHRPYNVLSQLIARALRGETIEIFGEGSQLRDYLHVDDAIEALVHLALLDENVTVNVGSGVGTRFVDVARLIVDRAGSGTLSFVPWPDGALRVETGDFVADISAVRALGWRPRVAIQEGIERTIREYREAS